MATFLKENKHAAAAAAITEQRGIIHGFCTLSAFGCEPHRPFDRLYYTPPMTEINPNALLCFALLW